MDHTVRGQRRPDGGERRVRWRPAIGHAGLPRRLRLDVRASGQGAFVVAITGKPLRAQGFHNGRDGDLGRWLPLSRRADLLSWSVDDHGHSAAAYKGSPREAQFEGWRACGMDRTPNYSVGRGTTKAFLPSIRRG
jgi:hypothetical protein